MIRMKMVSRSVNLCLKCLRTSSSYKGCWDPVFSFELKLPAVSRKLALVVTQNRFLSNSAFNLSDIVKANAKAKPNKSVGTTSSKQLNKSNAAKVKKKDLDTPKSGETLIDKSGKTKKTKKQPETEIAQSTENLDNNSNPKAQNEDVDMGKKPDCNSVNTVPAYIEALLNMPLISDKIIDTDRRAEFKEFVEDLELKYLPSVSTIINQTQSPEQAKVLERWKDRMVKELGGEVQFNQYKRGLLDNGVNLHECIYSKLSGNPDDTELRKGNEGHWESISKVLPDVSDVIFMEKECVHPELFYRGKFDCIAKYRGTLCLIEWKTSAKAKPLLSNTYDNPLQIAAYLGAVNRSNMLKKQGVDQLTSGAIVIAYTDGEPATVHAMNQKQCERYWKLWVKRLYTFWLSKYDQMTAI